MNTQQHFMRQAVDLAKEAVARLDGGPFGCVIVKNGVVIGKGWNHVMKTNDPTAHAEIMAIRDACTGLGTPELVGCELYSSSEPCPMCMAAIYWACISKVYYSNTKDESTRLGYEDAIIYREFRKPMQEWKIDMVHLHDEEGKKVFAEWEKRNSG